MPDPATPADGKKVTSANGRLLQLILIGVLVAGGVGLAFWLGYTPPAAEQPPPESPGFEDEDIERVLAVVNPGYVGIEVCAQCHAQRASVVKTTRHFLACRTAAEGVTAPGFAQGKGLFSTSVAGLQFEMSRTGTDFFLTRIESTPQGQQRSRYQIGLVYGSGSKHDEMYFAWQDDRLYHLPVAWLHPYQRWGLASHVHVPLQTHSSCLECHNTWVGHVPGTVNQYRREEMHLGVTCERCHGPGKQHTDYHRAHPDDAAHAILHPGSLSRERLMDLCAQCHANAKRFGQPFSYRPGEPLEAFFHNFKPTHPEDDTTNQVRYLGESKCYQKSEMTCISCHDPHRPKSAQGACLKCHTSASCTDQHRLPEPVRGDCVGCHMPSRVWTHAHLYNTTDDQYIPLAPRADHRIGVYPEARKAVLLAWLRKQTDPDSRTEATKLTDQVTQYWVNEADRRRRVGRFKASMGAFREALRITPDAPIRKQLQEVINLQSELDDLSHKLRLVDRVDLAIPLLKRMLEINPNSAFAHGELGSIYSDMGNQKEALTHLQAVAKCEPTDAYGLIRLAEMAYRAGRLEEAATLCAQANEINPISPLNRQLWGSVFLKQGRWQDAETQFRKVLLSEPTHPAGNGGLSEALRHQGQVAEAVRFARRATHWSKWQDVELMMTLADAYVAANRIADARATLERALPVAAHTHPELVDTIRTRLIELR